MIPSGIAPQLTITSSLDARLLPKCNALLTNSFPVPDSPLIKTEISTFAVSYTHLTLPTTGIV